MSMSVDSQTILMNYDVSGNKNIKEHELKLKVLLFSSFSLIQKSFSDF